MASVNALDLARILLDAGNPDAAEIALRAIPDAENNVRALKLRTRFCFDTEDWAGALTTSERILTIEPESPWPIVRIAEAQQQQRREPRAVETLTQFINGTEPGTPEGQARAEEFLSLLVECLRAGSLVAVFPSIELTLANRFFSVPSLTHWALHLRLAHDAGTRVIKERQE